MDSLISKAIRENIGSIILKEHSDEARAKLRDFLKHADNEIYIVTSDLNPSYWNEDIAKILGERFDRNPALSVKILFHKENIVLKDHDKDTVKRYIIEKLKTDNEKLINLFKKISEKEMKFSLFWANKRPVYHFAIFDDNLMTESKHHAHENRDVFIKENDRELCEKYKGYFKTMISDTNIVVQLHARDFGYIHLKKIKNE